MLTGLLVGAALELAVVNVVLGMLVAWGLAGGDGEAANPVAPVLGLAAFVATIATVVVTVRLLSPAAVVAAVAVIAVAVVVTYAWLSAYTEDSKRRQLWVALAIVALAAPVALGMAEGARPPATRTVLVAAAVPLLTASGMVVAGQGVRGDADSWWSVALPAISLMAPPLLLAGALLGE